MSTLRTGRQIEYCGLPLAFPISPQRPLKLLNLFRPEKESPRRRRPQSRSFTVEHRPTPAPPLLAAVFSLMADSISSGDAELNSVDRACTEIVVIRHGETEWNAEKRIQGHLDVDLNDVGRQQAVAVAKRLSGESPISAVYSSDLKRALETAQIIASSCGGLEVNQDPNLRERHLGDLQGLVYGEAPKIKTKAYEALQSHRTDAEIPGGGESLDQLYKRCTSSLQMIGNKHRGERVVVVTHGGVVRALHKRASPRGRGAGKYPILQSMFFTYQILTNG